MDLAAATLAYFERVQRDVFAGDPVANPNLEVEVIAPTVVAGTPTLVLVTPWTLNGMIFGKLTGFPAELRVGAKTYPVFANTLAELGPYRSINLVADVSTLDSQESARKTARAFVQPFQEAVAAALEQAQIEDPDRRDLLRGLIRPAPDEPPAT